MASGDHCGTGAIHCQPCSSKDQTTFAIRQRPLEERYIGEWPMVMKLGRILTERFEIQAYPRHQAVSSPAKRVLGIRLARLRYLNLAVCYPRIEPY